MRPHGFTTLVRVVSALVNIYSSMNKMNLKDGINDVILEIVVHGFV